MDHSESSSPLHRCTDHRSPEICGKPIFYTTRLCEKRLYPKGDFDLTDPNGFRLSTDYNCLHDPNLKTYLYRKDIHKHLLRDGFITKDNKVTCSFKEFNTYRKYLTEVQREVDHRFKMEQKELLRKLLILQEDGRISPDISVSNFIEWVLFHGRDHVENDSERSRPKKPQSCGSNVLKLPKVKTQSKSLDKSHFSDTVYNTRQQQMLNKVAEDMRRELRLERRWKEPWHRQEQLRKKWHEPDVATQVKGLRSSLTSIRNSSLKKGRGASGDTLMRKRPTLKKLAPLPHREKINITSDCVYAETLVTAGGDARKNSHFLELRDMSGNRDISVITPPMSVPIKTSESSICEDTDGDLLETDTVLERSEQKLTVDKDQIFNLMEGNSQVITDIVTRVMDDIIGVIIPAMQQFIDESSPVKQRTSEDTQTVNNDICHVEDTESDDGMLLHTGGVPPPMSPQSSIHYYQKPDSSKTESVLGDECGPLNMDLVKKAERVIWTVIQEAMEQIKILVSSAVEGAESQCSSHDHGQFLKSTSGSTHIGCNDGDKVLLNKLSVSVVTPPAQREFVACTEQINPAANKSHQGDDIGNQVKAQLLEPKLCFGCDTAQRNTIYSEFVDDILVRVYSLFPDESAETTSPTETVSSPSSSRIQNVCLPLLAETSSSAPVCCASGWEHYVTSANPKPLVGQPIRLLTARPETSRPQEVMAVETEPYADEMVMGIMEQLEYETEQQSRESKHSETPDSFISSEDSAVMGHSINFPLVIKLNRQPKTRHHEAVEISHQILLSIKRQIDEGYSSATTDVSKAMEKDILCEFVDKVLDKLSNMCNSIYSITNIVEMKNCEPEGFEPPRPEKSLKVSDIMEDAKMQFEKAACQPVKAVLENAFSDFFSQSVDLSSCHSCLSATGNNQTDLSSLASDIVFIVWEKLIETSGCNTSDCTSNNESKLKELMKTISEVSSLKPSVTHPDSPTLKAECAMEGINCAVKTKVRHFVTRKSKDGQKETDIDSIVKKTAIINRSEDVMNGHSKSVSSGQDLHLISTTSRSAIKHSNGPSLCSKQTYGSSQITCSFSPLSTSEHDDFSEALSKSAMSLLKDTYGEQATSMKTKKDATSCTADPTFEGLVIQPLVNRRDLIVQKVAVEELSSVYLTDSIQSEGKHQRSTRFAQFLKPPEDIFSRIPEQVDVLGEANVRIYSSQITQPDNQARPTSAMLCILRPAIEKVTLKVINKCMLGSEFITKQRVGPCEMWILQNRRSQSAKATHEREKITLTCGSTQQTLFDLRTKSMKDRRPHSAAAHSTGVKQTSGSRGSTALYACSNQDHHNKLQNFPTQSSSASGASSKEEDMFWKNLRKVQTSVYPVTDCFGKGSSSVEANSDQQQENGDRVHMSIQRTNRKTPPFVAETIKDILANLMVNLYSDAPNTPIGTSSPISDPASLHLFDSVLGQMERFHMLDEVSAEQLSSAHINIQEVARSVYRDLVRCCGSCANLHLAISSCEDRIVEKIACSLALSLSMSTQRKDDLSRDNLSSRASTRLSSLASTRLSSPTSWVTEETLAVSERSSTCSLEMAEDLMDAVMAELYSDQEKCGTPQLVELDWPQLSLAELNHAAKEVYKHMLEQCGSVKNLQGALRSREKEVVNKMAVAIASQTYKLISSEESSDTLLPDQTSNLNYSLSVGSSPAQCALFYQAVWDIISTLMLELCKKKGQGQHLTPKLFLKSLSTLSECPGVKICNDSKLCDISSDSIAVERIVLHVRRRLSEDSNYWSTLESLLTTKDEAAEKIVVITVVEEILKFASHPFDIIQVPPANLYYSDPAGGMAQDLTAPYAVSIQDANFKSRCENQQTSDVYSLRSGKPHSAPDSRVPTPVLPDLTKRNSRQSSAISSKKVTFMPFIDFYSKSQVPLKRESKMSDEADHPAIRLKHRRVISCKIKKHSSKGRPAKPRKPYVENNRNMETTRVKSLGSLLSKLFHV